MELFFEWDPEAQAASTTESGDVDELLPEYDLRGGTRGKYAERYAAGTNVVLLDPDVAAAFPNAAAVNEALRALVSIAKRHATRKTPAA